MLRWALRPELYAKPWENQYMAFMVYEKAGEQEGLEVLELKVAKVAFGGNRKGILYKYLTKSRELDKAKQQSKHGHAWSVSAEGLLMAAFENAQSLRLVIDLKPNVKSNISLYMVNNVWGVTYPKWTPVMLELTPLFVDKDVPEEMRAVCKRKFLYDPDPKAHEPVFDFFYLQGGYADGNWNPGRLGGYNGALLWPDAASFFIATIRRVLDTLPSEGRRARHALPCETP